MAGKRQRLGGGELETLVLHTLWAAEAWLMPGEVAVELEPSHPLAYSSVTTILVRLWRKGLLERRIEGRGYAYRPVWSREELAAQRMQQLLESSGDHDAALAHFIDAIPNGDRRQLRRILDKRRRSS